MPAPNETRERAMESVRQADTGPALAHLLELARQGQEQVLLEQLRRHEAIGEWSPPARDALLHAFAVTLGDLHAGTVGPAVFEFLDSVEPLTRVPHFDHPQVGVPLYNIRAAAAGSRNRWMYDEARTRSARMLSQGETPAWLETFRAQPRTGRQGMVDSLADVNPDQSLAIGKAAIAGIEDDPALTAVVIRSAFLAQDFTLFKSAVLNGSGPDLAPALGAFSTAFTAQEAVVLARESIAVAPPATSALVLAQLAHQLATDSQMVELLFETLSHHELGAAAAMTLARHPDPVVRERLQNLAQSDNGVAAGRAALAIAMPEPGEREK